MQESGERVGEGPERDAFSRIENSGILFEINRYIKNFGNVMVQLAFNQIHMSCPTFTFLKTINFLDIS